MLAALLADRIAAWAILGSDHPVVRMARSACFRSDGEYGTLVSHRVAPIADARKQPVQGRNFRW